MIDWNTAGAILVFAFTVIALSVDMVPAVFPLGIILGASAVLSLWFLTDDVLRSSNGGLSKGGGNDG